MFLYPEEIDKRLSWPIGKAKRLARSNRLPHILLPDGSIRFEWDKIEALLIRVPLEEDPDPLIGQECFSCGESAEHFIIDRIWGDRHVCTRCKESLAHEDADLEPN